MTAAPISLQDLQRRLYVKAKAEKDWRVWGLYVHVGKLETLRAAYAVAKQNDGAPDIDRVTFEAIEAAGVESFLAQLRDELVARTYRPLRNRRVEIPKGEGRVRILSGHTGKREQAREHLTTATAMYREMDMRFWLEQAAMATTELA